jgi:hypothetical protein
VVGRYRTIQFFSICAMIITALKGVMRTLTKYSGKNTKHEESKASIKGYYGPSGIRLPHEMESLVKIPPAIDGLEDNRRKRTSVVWAVQNLVIMTKAYEVLPGKQWTRTC